MGLRHNNQLPNNHFHKDWQRRVKTWFDQPGRKKRRRNARVEKAARIAPRPIELLRPAVRCPTVKYNTKLRAGRGFTLEEIKAAGIRRKEALSIGIPVDHRRRNRSAESLDLNVARLGAYKSKLIIFPAKNAKKAVKAKAKEELGKPSSHKQISLGDVLPIVQVAPESEPRAITDEEKSFSAYSTLRKERSDARLIGVRAARQKAKEEEEASKKK